MTNESELNALIRLLDDPDPEVYNHVFEKLLNIGPTAIEVLESAYETSPDAKLHNRIEALIHQIQFDSLYNDISKWVKYNSNDLLEGVIHIAKFQYPGLNVHKIYNEIEIVKRDIWLEINNYLKPIEQVNVFNQIFYQNHNFKGVVRKKLTAESFYINRVLESKKGNPLSLGIIYLILGRELGLPIHGVNLPHHFVLCMTKNNVEFDAENIEKEIQFYINPFNKGMIFSRNDIKRFLEKLKVSVKNEYFKPCDNMAIMQTMITSLIEFYKKDNKQEKVEDLEILLSVLD